MHRWRYALLDGSPRRTTAGLFRDLSVRDTEEEREDALIDAPQAFRAEARALF